MSAEVEAGLRDGVRELELVLDERQLGQLVAYLDLMQKWNQVYNLTAVRDPESMLRQHLLDSLALIAPLRRELAERASPEGGRVRVLDVGSGGGLPGVVLAIACPELAVSCVDTVAKKASFVRQVAISLGLPHLRGLHARVESLTESFDVICSRAFASLGDFTNWSRGALAPGGVWMAMKGKLPQEEMADLPVDVEVFHVEHLQVPGLDAERCIVWMRSVS